MVRNVTQRAGLIGGFPSPARFERRMRGSRVFTLRGPSCSPPQMCRPHRGYSSGMYRLTHLGQLGALALPPEGL